MRKEEALKSTRGEEGGRRGIVEVADTLLPPLLLLDRYSRDRVRGGEGGLFPPTPPFLKSRGIKRGARYGTTNWRFYERRMAASHGTSLSLSLSLSARESPPTFFLSSTFEDFETSSALGKRRISESDVGQGSL